MIPRLKLVYDGEEIISRKILDGMLFLFFLAHNGQGLLPSDKIMEKIDESSGERTLGFGSEGSLSRLAFIA